MEEMQDELMRLKGDHKMPFKDLMKRTLHYVKPELGWFIISMLILAITIGIEIIGPYFISIFISSQN